MKDTPKSGKRTTGNQKPVAKFTDEERAAMKDRVQELKASPRRGPRADDADEESAVLAKLAEMPEGGFRLVRADRVPIGVAQRVELATLQHPHALDCDGSLPHHWP